MVDSLVQIYVLFNLKNYFVIFMCAEFNVIVINLSKVAILLSS